MKTYLTKQGVIKLKSKAIAYEYLSENTEAIVNTYVLGYLDESKEDFEKSEKVIRKICEQLQIVEDNLYKKEGIHPNTFSKNSILGVEQEYFRKVKFIEDVMRSEVHTIFEESFI